MLVDAAPQPLHDLVVFLFADRHDLLDAQRRGIVGRRDPRGQCCGPSSVQKSQTRSGCSEHHALER